MDNNKNTLNYVDKLVNKEESNGCKNLVELFYHPFVYKSLECINEDCKFKT
jgi:hypothetical protein